MEIREATINYYARVHRLFKSSAIFHSFRVGKSVLGFLVEGGIKSKNTGKENLSLINAGKSDEAICVTLYGVQSLFPTEKWCL